MSKQLRYLLHGNRDKYEDIETPLYIASQESTLWQKLGQQVLQEKGEAWRLIDSSLVEHIPSAKQQLLGIQLLQSEEVVDLIRELEADSVDGKLLEASERYGLLRHIRQRPNNEELWKALPIHEAINDELVCIEPDKMYLENPDFPLDESLEEHIVLIRQNQQEIDQSWIQIWSPDQLISKVLNLPNPDKFCNLILNALQKLSSSEKEEWKSQLKNTPWLVDRNGKAIQPQDILRLPEQLVKHQEIICTLDSNKFIENSLHKKITNHQAYNWVKKLFTFWDEQKILKKIFNSPQEPFANYSSFSTVILDSLQNIDISKDEDLEMTLRTETWLVLDDSLIAPKQVIEITPKKIQKHLSTIIELSGGVYAEFSVLPKYIQNHQNLKIIKKLFPVGMKMMLLNLLSSSLNLT